MSLHGESLPVPSMRSAPQQRIPLNVLFGVPDDGKGVVRVTPDGRRLAADATLPAGKSFILRGSANIAPFLSPERFALNRFYLQSNAGTQIKLGPGSILNHIADPDICSRALAMVGRIADQVLRPCFNHPSAVARTTRDGVASLLHGIERLIVPKTIRVERTSPAHVREAAREADLRYPILVRVVGSHGGEDRVQIERPEAMDEINQLEHKGRSLFLTEFHDFASPDGLYRKFRVVIVGDDIFVRHCVVASHWSVHGRHRVEGADKEEEEVFEAFDSEWAPSLKPIFAEMTRRLGLDYFGVDCHIDRDRNVLLFEANACMKVLKNYKVSPNRFDAPIAKIKRALEDRLAAPETWRCARTDG
jgi:glutathione synthase/RimK-type ligase-like ATP-grasp enzyme